MIFAYHNPDSQLATSVLAAVTFNGGNAANLRITPINLCGAIMMITGSILQTVTYHYLGRFFRFEASIQEDYQLVTEGPYSIVRHPSYTGLLLTHSGWFLWHFGAGSWVQALSGLWSTVVGKLVVLSFAGVVILGALYRALSKMAAEDQALQKRFGTQWDEWAS
jgi:protein-S-isoprenylcysteine O-methyltransferase Ste14